MKAKAHWGYPKEVLDGWRAELAISASEIRAKPTYVAAEGGEIVGFYSLEPSSVRSWKLDNLWVMPEYMNRGIGRALLNHALETAARGGASEVTVDADPNAAAFYLQCGAVRRGEVAAPIPGHPARVRPQLAFEIPWRIVVLVTAEQCASKSHAGRAWEQRPKLRAIRNSAPCACAGWTAPSRRSTWNKETSMQLQLGRLIDHVHLRVSDLEASKRFYRAVVASLAKPDALVEGDGFFHADELFVDKADGPVSRVHLAFQARDREAVKAFHRAALSAGGRDNGGPGERPYHPGYYAAFVLDPDGNNIEAVFHGPATRSAPSVVVTSANE